MNSLPQDLPRYDTSRTYAWNYQHAPEPIHTRIPALPGRWTFCGIPVDSPLGIPAGPLLNGKWVIYYAHLGFDVLTYKTVRSVARDCYRLPNLQPVECGQLMGDETELPSSDRMTGSWAVSFGMPSKAPADWREDVAATRKTLPSNKLLSVSVVGSVQEGWSIEQLADDYARCARWAVENGADTIETNFSCPNVSTCDGQLYQQPVEAEVVAATVRGQIGDAPYIIKIGHVLEEERAVDLIESVGSYIDAFAMTNSVAATVRNHHDQLLFDGARRGICGDATRAASIQQTRMFGRLIRDRGLNIRLIGVGGVSSAQHVREYLDAGAEATHIATAAMVDPRVAISIREELSTS